MNMLSHLGTALVCACLISSLSAAEHTVIRSNFGAGAATLAAPAPKPPLKKLPNIKDFLSYLKVTLVDGSRVAHYKEPIRAKLKLLFSDKTPSKEEESSYSIGTYPERARNLLKEVSNIEVLCISAYLMTEDPSLASSDPKKEPVDPLEILNEFFGVCAEELSRDDSTKIDYYFNGAAEATRLFMCEFSRFKFDDYARVSEEMRRLCRERSLLDSSLEH